MSAKKAWYERNKERLKQEYREKHPVQTRKVKYQYKDKDGKYIYEYEPEKRHEKHVRLYKSQATIYKQQLRMEKREQPVQPVYVYIPPVVRAIKKDRNKIRNELTYEKDGKVFYNFNILKRLS